MNKSPDTKGDVGKFIIAELNSRGIALPNRADLPSLPATWRTITLEIAGAPKNVGVGVDGCSLADVSAFCFSLFSAFRVQRPFSNDNDGSFFFSVNGKPGNYMKTDVGLVVSFITSGVAVTLADSEHGVFIGFAERPVA